VIEPEDYARWRNSRLGALTESIEQRVISALCGNLSDLWVLDLGCGDGTYGIRAFEAGALVVGLDISIAMLRAAHIRAVARAARVRWIQGLIGVLPFATNAFDLVIAVGALCFSHDPSGAIREAARVLRPGGSLVVGELGKCSCWAASRRIRAWLGSKTWSAARFWSVRELRSTVTEAGLQFEGARCCVYYPPVTSIAEALSPLEGHLSCLGQFGAAFIAVKATKGLVTRG
jgi:SAM-dependent methyltransferase